MDLQKIIKLLNLTTSDNDHEALIAIRIANRILKSENKTWENFVQKAKATSYDQSWSRPASDPPPKEKTYQKPQEEDDISEMFEVVRDKTTHPFIESLYEQWATWGNLTVRQKDALKKFYRNCV